MPHSRSHYPRGVPFRRLSLRAALGAVAASTVLAASTGGLVPASATAAPDPGRDHQRSAVPASYDAPLLVTIDQLTPGELPRRGPVVVRGTVVNRDVETWSGISLYPFINAGIDCDGCPPPITTDAELVAAAESDPLDVVGNRILDVSATVDELGPGQVAPYTITVPRRLLPVTSAGVYWFGVHALGASEGSPDDGVADGRARTFLPYVPRGRDGVRGRLDTAVVVPLRYRIRHLANGRLAKRRGWEDAFGPVGELGAPLAFGSAAVGKPVTWLVDPAVLDAARQLRRGNPPRDLGPKSSDSPGDTSPTDDPSASPDEPETPVADDPVATAAANWLDAVEVQLRSEEVLALPYGDVDMSATPDRLPELYPVARERIGDVLSSWEIPTTPAVASPGGYLDPSVLPGIDDDSTLLLTDRMFDSASFRDGPPVVGEYDGHVIAPTSYGAATGGPGPEPRLGSMAFRQRVLAEAALRLLAPGRRHPLIVVVPREVDGTGGTFWSGLDLDWINLTTVADVTDRTSTEVDPETLSYPIAQESAELPASVFAEADALIEAGTTLQHVLTDVGTLSKEVEGEALAGLSYSFRTDADAAAARLARSRRWMARRLRSIGIDGPPAVTLSSADGSFAVTVTNPLDRTVTVRIAAESVDGEVDVDVGEPVVLAGDSRTTILLDAHTRGTGVHNVTLSVTDPDGTPLGSSVEVPIRSGQVSEVIWVILGTGVGILFVAIALRIFRRIRARAARRAAAAGGADGAPAEVEA